MPHGPFEPSPRHKLIAGISGLSSMIFAMVGIIGNGGFGHIRNDHPATQIGVAGFVICCLIYMLTMGHAFLMWLTESR
jgi:hypothetical protein